MPISKPQEVRTVINTFSQSPRAEQVKTSVLFLLLLPHTSKLCLLKPLACVVKFLSQS